MRSMLTVVAGTILAGVLLTGCGSGYSNLEKSAVPVVNQIIKENMGADAASCEAVKVTKKVSNYFYQAVAYLDNGEEVKLTIKDMCDQIYVTIAE